MPTDEPQQGPLRRYVADLAKMSAQEAEALLAAARQVAEDAPAPMPEQREILRRLLARIARERPDGAGRRARRRDDTPR